MVLSKLSVQGRPTNLDNSRARAYCLTVDAGWVCLDIFSHVTLFQFLLHSAISFKFNPALSLVAFCEQTM